MKFRSINQSINLWEDIFLGCNHLSEIEANTYHNNDDNNTKIRSICQCQRQSSLTPNSLRLPLNFKCQNSQVLISLSNFGAIWKLLKKSTFCNFKFFKIILIKTFQRRTHLICNFKLI